MDVVAKTAKGGSLGETCRTLNLKAETDLEAEFLARMNAVMMQGGAITVHRSGHDPFVLYYGDDPVPEEPDPTPDTRPPLTARQRLVLDAIRDWNAARGYMPTIRNLGIAMGIGSPNGMMHHLNALQRKGYIARDKNVARGLRIL